MTQPLPIVGAYYHPPAKSILQVLPAGTPLWLEPEPDNIHDPNAVKILVASANIPQSAHEELALLAALQGWSLEEILCEETWHLGYVPRGLAPSVCRALEAGGSTLATLCFSPKGAPLAAWDEPSMEIYK
jgi:HIRAN domain